MAGPDGTTSEEGASRPTRAALRGLGPSQVVRLAFRKLIYRRVELVQMGVRAHRSVAPSADPGTHLEFWGPDRFDEVLGTTPYLSVEDVAHFRRQASTVIVALDGSRIAASSWMTSGSVHVSELHRSIDVPADQHFSCRTYVDPAYGGRALMGHMIHAYSAAQQPNDLVWGLLYPRNRAAIRSVANIGWEHFGDHWTTFVLGRPRGGERHFEPRPIADRADR